MDTHSAADGELARVRVPGGRLDANQALALAAAAEEFGDGQLELTSRANVQVRGLDAARVGAFAAGLASVGLLPSATHEKIRNIVASPLSGRGVDGRCDVTALVEALDRALCAEPELAALPGRFLITVDDGGRDVAGLGGDIGLTATGPGSNDPVYLAVAGARDVVALRRHQVVGAVVAAARAFLAERAATGIPAWRVAELPTGHDRILAAAESAADGIRIHTTPKVDSTGTSNDQAGPSGDSPVRSDAHSPVHPPVQQHGRPAAALRPVGVVEQRDGRRALAVTVPLGRLSAAGTRVLVEAARDGSGELRLTPWRSVVVPDLPEAAASHWATAAALVGLVVDAASPWVGTSACAGRPGCAKSLADVRADAADVVWKLSDASDASCAQAESDQGSLANAWRASAAPIPTQPVHVHWSGCGRRCGAPAGPHIDVLATEDGYRVRFGEHDGERGGGTTADLRTVASAIRVARAQQ